MAEDGERWSAAAGEVWRTADLVTPMALRVAATLRVADHIVAGRRTAAEMAEPEDADAVALDRLLRFLASRGIVDRDAAGGYSLTERGEVLRSDHPSRVRERLDLDGALGRAELSSVQLLHSVRTGEAAYPAQYGRTFWDDLAADPALSASFDAAMGSDVAAWAPAILDAYDWGSLGHLVDVGGGNGTLLVAILNEHPTLRGTIVDLPATAEAARRTFADAGLSTRADAVAGSFFDRLPPGADGYMLTAIVHDWADEPARTVLRRCAQAAATHPAGRVFVVQKIGVDGRTPNSEMDLRLLVQLGGQERSLDELVVLCEDSGLRLAAVHPAGAISVLELGAAPAD